MPSPLKKWDSDPDAKGRGTGFYYLRSMSNSNPTQKIYAHYSKYSKVRDKKIIAKGYDIDPVGRPGGSPWLHTTDGILKVTKRVHNKILGKKR